MKKLTFSCAIVLGALFVIAGPLQAVEADTRLEPISVGEVSPNEDVAAVDVVPTLQTGSAETVLCVEEVSSEMRPRPNMCTAIGDCNRWDSSWCDYSCSGYECCRATILIAGAFCPDICA